MLSFNRTAQVSGLKVASFKLFAAVLLIGAFSVSGVQSAFANPFEKVAGSWRSAGATAIIKGNKEAIKCRARYDVPGRTVALSLKCSGPGYFINVSVDARVIGSRVRGSWNESQFSKRGSVSGRASNRSSRLTFVGSNLKGSMNISLTSGKRHTLYINSNGNRVIIPMRR